MAKLIVSSKSLSYLFYSVVVPAMTRYKECSNCGIMIIRGKNIFCTLDLHYKVTTDNEVIADATEHYCSIRCFNESHN